MNYSGIFKSIMALTKRIRLIPLHLPERGTFRMNIIRDMFGPGHSPLVSGAFFRPKINSSKLIL